MEFRTTKYTNLFVFLIFSILFSCNSRDYLEEALSLAGDNRVELERVLQHYKDDPLKLKSAKFLIENMVTHYSYVEENGLTSYYDKIDSLYSQTMSLSRAERVHLYDSVSSIYKEDGYTLKRVLDLQVITADYLIYNIDRSFQLWQKGNWAKHVSFEDFCEYLLPYKVLDGQTLDNWKEYGEEICKGDIDTLYFCSLYKNLAFKSCERVNTQLQKYLKPSIKNLNQIIPLRRVSTSMKMLQGVCDDYTFIATAVMRAKGIPVTMDFTPQWPFRNNGHSWNVLLDNFGKNIAFLGCQQDLGTPHKVEHKMAKVFRKTYAINRELEHFYKSERYLPPEFNDMCVKDVTNEYMKTYDVQIDLSNKVKNEYAYLAVFDNQRWVPIHWGKIKGRKVKFEMMGTNIVYLPVVYGSDKKLTPVAPPFLLNSLGEKKDIIPNKNESQTLNLYRKYFVPENVFWLLKRMIGGKIQASNYLDFRNAVTLYTIQEPGFITGKISFKKDTGKYRYWRYLSPDSCHCNIAELYFYTKGSLEPVYGNIIGTEWNCFDDSKKENVFDQNPLTIFDSKLPSGAWVGMDFKRPVAMEKIMYIPRSDGNSIVPGNEYELVYWDDGKWISLGSKIADNNYLEFRNCPKGALYLLHNQTDGIEERIFTYENNEQIWW